MIAGSDGQTREWLIARTRLAIGIFIAGLVASGVTAFPLLHELDLLARLLGIGNAAAPDALAGLSSWIFKVRAGLRETHAHYPFIAYGTDWLAFGHIVIAVFFIGPLVDPVRNVWVIQAGLIACALVIPLALICGPIRAIPFYWRLIDCSFGVFGALPLWYALRLTKQLQQRSSHPA
jgi:hypothetical protein